VQASVDRSSLPMNESFTYVLRAEGQVYGEPDVGPLERQFEVLQRTSSTRVQIVNGRAAQVAEWIFQLMPRSAGTVTIPPLEVAGKVSNPVELQILPAAAATDPLADVFLEVEAEPIAAYVQSQVLYTLRLFVGVGTGRATITPPEILGGEAIVERVGEDRQYQTSLGGRNFVVRERRYAIFPQRPGRLTIGPATFEAMVIPNRGFSRVQRFQSETLELTVRSAVAPPDAYPDAVWLPANAVSLSETWSAEPSGLAVGVPMTRMLTIEADGLLETQLPELRVAQAAGIRVYPDRPTLERSVTEDGLTARRIERYAVLAQTAGEAELPVVELPWFNVRQQRWEVARLPPRVMSIAPGDVTAPPIQEAAPREQRVEASVPAQSNFWRNVAGALALGWLTTILLVLRRSAAFGRRRPERLLPVLPRRPANRRLLKELRAACADGDARAARQALLQWAALRFAEAPPRTLGALADKLPTRLRTEVLELESQLYGRGAVEWDGSALAAALGEVDSVSRSSSGTDRDSLLPLYR
jgi:hypothetical protein